MTDFKEQINLRMNERKTNGRRPDSAEDNWNDFKMIVKEEMEKNIPKVKSCVRKPWITTEILELMDERRKWKNTQTEDGKRKYQRLNNEIRRKCNN